MSSQRLILFSGKGGVGKSELSRSYALALQQCNPSLKVQTVSLDGSSLKKDLQGHHETRFSIDGITITHKSLELESALREYMARKLHSRVMANWIAGNSFFRGLINMLPGLGFVILLGQVLSELEERPNLVTIIDAPASGHMLTLIESIRSFRKIFQHGALFEDASQVLSLLERPNYAKLFVVCLPGPVPYQEAKELTDQVENSLAIETQLVMNNCMFRHFDESNDKLPDSLGKKLDIERSILERSHNPFSIDLVPGDDTVRRRSIASQFKASWGHTS